MPEAVREPETDLETHHETQEPKRKRRPPVYARELPAEGFVRLQTVLTVIPVGPSTWWKGIKSGRFPPGKKFGPRLTMWPVESIRALLERTAQGDTAA